ncbi:MAG: hypothetical protein P1P83_10840 [Bacteroidales bacterium]|nr:hypothetical protein [Bacteroidales bacterium]MDT8373892.1 hypothetical protein [Bacteroidales bacterium]
MAGFAGYKYRKKVKNTGVIASDNIGRGAVVYLSDNPYFRAYWKSGRVLPGNLLLRQVPSQIIFGILVFSNG